MKPTYKNKDLGIILDNNDCLLSMKNIPNNSIDLIVTDPPYRCCSGGKPQKEKGAPSGILSKNDGKIFKYNDILPEIWIPQAYRVLKPNSQCYIMVNTLNLENYLRICRECGFKLHSVLVWQKNNMTPSRWYMKNCEFTLFLRKGKAKVINNIGSPMVHKFNNIIGNKSHPTEKPIKLMQYYIENSSNTGDIVLDMFMGTGSTGVACIQSNRKFIGIEIDEEYYKIAKQRILKEKIIK